MKKYFNLKQLTLVTRNEPSTTPSVSPDDFSDKTKKDNFRSKVSGENHAEIKKNLVFMNWNWIHLMSRDINRIFAPMSFHLAAVVPRDDCCRLHRAEAGCASFRGPVLCIRSFRPPMRPFPTSPFPRRELAPFLSSRTGNGGFRNSEESRHWLKPRGMCLKSKPWRQDPSWWTLLLNSQESVKLS